MNRKFVAAITVSLLGTAGCGTSGSLSASDRDLRVADIELASGAPSSALQLAQGVVARMPGNVDALTRIGEADSALGESEAAETSFRQALDRDAGAQRAALGLARLHLRSDPRQALSDFRRLAVRSPQDPHILTDLGVAYDLLSQSRQAQVAYRQALAIAPNLASAQVDLGLSLAISGDAGKALAILGPLAQGADTSARIRQDYAVAAALDGRSQDASDVLTHDLPKEQVSLALDAYRTFQTR